MQAKSLPFCNGASGGPSIQTLVVLCGPINDLDGFGGHQRPRA